MSILKTDKLYSTDRSTGSDENILLNDDGTTSFKGNVAVTGNVTVTGTLPADKLTGTLPAISGENLTRIPLSFRNLIINGACNVAQRGSATATIGYASVDRFTIAQSGGQNSPDQAQRALTSSDTGPWAKGFRNCYKMTNGNQTSADADDYSIIYYKLEAQDIANSGWDYTNSNSKITLSFWVKTSVAETYYFDLMTNDGTSQGYCMSTGALSANTWTKIEKTIPGNSNLQFDNNEGSGLEIGFNLYYGSNYTDAGRALDTWAAWASGTRTPVNDSSWWLTDDATFELTGLQLEVGDIATEFEHRSFGDELARCQRYYYRHVDASEHSDTNRTIAMMAYYDATQANGIIGFPVEMRTIPTLEASGGTQYYKIYSNASSLYWTNAAPVNWEPGLNTGGFYAPSDGGSNQGNAAYVRTNNASAKMAWGAEL